MLPYRRERAEEFILQEVTLLLRRAVRDPRVRELTVTGVNLTPDRRLARIYVACYCGDEDVLREAMKGLESAKSFIRHKLSQSLHWRFTPEIEFREDHSWEHGERIEALLREVLPPEEEQPDDDEPAS